MPISNRVPASVLVLGCVLFLTSEVVAQTQGGQNINVRGLRTVQLRPAADTEVQLSEAFLVRDDQGRLKFAMSGPLQNDKLERMFWLVDPSTNKYTVIRLSGQDAVDASRISKLYLDHGVDQPAANFVKRLRDGRSAAEKRSSEAKDEIMRRGSGKSPAEPSATCALPDEAVHGPSAEEESQLFDTCQGYGWVEVELWELAKVAGLPVDHLNETNIEVRWLRDTPISVPSNTTYSVDASGNCWANPETFIFTHWFITWCSPAYKTIDPLSFDTNKVGSYLNVDFLPVLGLLLGLMLPPEAVLVTSSASVQHVYGMANWGHTLDIGASAEWFAWVGTAFLLTGVVNGDAFEYNCVTRCSPEPQVLADCNSNPEFPGDWDYENCRCNQLGSPIIIDLDADGLSLTAPSKGVSFDLLANGLPVQTAWTTATANDAFLVLDRNGNGRIDDGAELFGDRTPQPLLDRRPGKHGPNGFLALAVFDQRQAGGNEDGQISEEDPIYQRLRLWTDANHDGFAQAGELSPLAGKGVRSISLRYKRGRQVDEFGNEFRFLSHVAMDHSALSPGPIVRQAIDVFLMYAR